MLRLLTQMLGIGWMEKSHRPDLESGIKPAQNDAEQTYKIAGALNG